MNQDSTVSPFAFSVPGQPCAKTFVFPPPTLRTVTPDMALPPRLEQSVNALHSLRNGALKPLSRQPFYGSNQSLNSMGCTPVPPSTPLTLPNPHLEPIEGGLVTKSRSRSNSNYDAMTDDEREEAQRMKRKEEAFKTALCDAYKRTGACSYGDTCRFAHGEQELRLPPQPRGKAHPKYKTQLCDKFSLYGICPYGQRCQFIHKLKKGFPLVEYERLVSQGQISPAREHEIKLVDQSPVKSGWQTLRLDVPPPSMLKTRNGREVQLTKEKVDLPHKRQFGKELNNRVSSNFINQRAARLEAKRRHVLEEALHDAVRQEEEERRELERRAEERIKRIQEQIHSLNMDEYGYGNPLARSSSLHSLVDNNRSARCNVREAEMRGQFASHTDLSLITEEPDKENYDGSFVPRMTGDERVDAGWQEMIFGKKYHGMGDCDVGFHEDVQDSGNSGHDLEDCQDTADRNLLVQSCDEELLTQGLYDFRYADPSHIVEGWRRSENAYSNGH